MTKAGRRRSLALAAGLLLTACAPGHGAPLAPAAVEGGAPFQASVGASAAPTPASSLPLGTGGLNAALPVPPQTPAELPPDVVLPAEHRLNALYRVPTHNPVVFLTIDDGLVRSPEAQWLLLHAHVPYVIFPTAEAVHADPAFFAPLLAAGAELGDHSVTHPVLRGLSLAEQEAEVCAGAGEERAQLGVEPQWLRPPFGAFDADTEAAGSACGLTHFLLWDATVNVGVVRNYEGVVTPRNPLRPGDIVLMHFRTTFRQDFEGALAAARISGLHFALLGPYLGPSSPSLTALVRQQQARSGFLSLRP